MYVCVSECVSERMSVCVCECMCVRVRVCECSMLSECNLSEKRKQCDNYSEHG